MISLVGLLDKYIFAGVPSNAAYDLLKAAWGKAHAKSWEALYVESFQQVVKDEAKTLAKYTGRGGEVELNDAKLAKALHRDLAVDPAILPFSALSDSEFAARLGKAMAERSVLVIGGHNLSPDDYAQLVRNLVQQARARFKSAILVDENAFRKALLEEALATQATVEETQSLVGKVHIYLADRFDVVLERLDEIRADVKEIKRTLKEQPQPQPSASQSKALKKVMISSTAHDLPEHRKEVMDACMRQGMFPMMMEHLPASDADAIEASLRMVDEADIYLGVFAHRYGYVPKGHDISITEMEYNRAVERKIPRLIFVMDKDHPIKIEDVEMENATRLKAFKDRVQTENIVNFFKSPADLRAHVINSLSQLRKPDLTAFHYVSGIPAPPEAYIAHPYTLLQTHRLIGRQAELNLLTDWVTGPHPPAPSPVAKTATGERESLSRARILNIVAIGGMGKSALTWKWFNEIAPQVMKPLAGRMWWSFYESDASFENFVIRALAYVTQSSREAVQKISPLDREVQLLAVLDREPFLLALDGLERILLAYARMDAAHLADDDIDQRTANYVAKAYGLPESAAQSFIGQHQLRKTADPRAGAFLRKLTNVRAARILVSTRLYPADLQTVTGEPAHGCSAIFLRGLNDDDALDLWRAFNVSGSRETLLPMFHKFENHPLLLQSLASEVANYRRAPGDFERWKIDHPNFDPFNLSLVNARVHVLEFALRGLSTKARKVLETIAAFRMPARYDTLSALLVEKVNEKDKPKNTRKSKQQKAQKPCADERELDVVLTELEDRGLVGWDKRANRYDQHPIVRGVAMSNLEDSKRRKLYATLSRYFEPLAYTNFDTFDLDATVELYHSFIGQMHYDDAWAKLNERHVSSWLRSLLDNRSYTELLEALFPEGLDKLPSVNVNSQGAACHILSRAYQGSGSPSRAVLLARKAVDLAEGETNRSLALGNLADALRLSGALHSAEMAARESMLILHKLSKEVFAWVSAKQKEQQEADGWHSFGGEFHVLTEKGWEISWQTMLQRYHELEAEELEQLGLILASRGLVQVAEQALRRSLRFVSDPMFYGDLAQLILWMRDITRISALTDSSWYVHGLVYPPNYNIDVRLARLQGLAALTLNDIQSAEKHLQFSLRKAIEIQYIEEEALSAISCAELRRRQGDLKAARELLGDVWEPAERGPYPLIHADAFNVLVQIERDAGNLAAAVEAATQAYCLAWCDGEPFAYHWGLVAARKHLAELGAPEPPMPPFDASKYEPMPEVEINPYDKFHVEENET